MHKIIDDIFQSAVGKRNWHSTVLTGGSDNHVFRVSDGKDDLVIRLHSDYAAMYRKEIWVMARASDVGIKVPRVHHVGEYAGYDYIVMGYIAGAVATTVSDTAAVYRRAGAAARLLNEIPVEGFGLDFNPHPAPHFGKSWRQEIEGNFAYIFGDDILLRLNVLTETQFQKAKAFVRSMADWEYPARLSHNDLCLDNMIVGDDGSLTLIDWSKAGGLPAPYIDIGDRLALARPDDFAAFTKGYGLSSKELQALRSELDKVRLNNVLRAVVWAARDWQVLLEDFKARTQDCLQSLGI